MYELVDYGDNIPDSIFDGNGNQFNRVENDEPYSEAVIYQQVDKNVRSDHSMLKLIIINGTIYEWIPKLGSSNLHYQKVGHV